VKWFSYMTSQADYLDNLGYLDHAGIGSRSTGWLLWKYRLRGIAYYAFNDWSANPWSQPMTGTRNGERCLLYPHHVRTRRVTVDDCSLSREMGIYDEYTMLNDMNIEAVSSSPFELMVDKTGSGTGTVASMPTGIDCGTQCPVRCGDSGGACRHRVARGGIHRMVGGLQRHRRLLAGYECSPFGDGIVCHCRCGQ
jgi:hypothetical protein